MSSRKLRKQLNQILRSRGLARPYSGPKLKAFKWLDSARMRDMINYLQIPVGTITHEWGVNQVVSEAPKVYFWDMTLRSRRGDKKIGAVTQEIEVKYQSGYLSCGCGAWACWLSNDAPKTKKEIVDGFKENLSGDWPDSLSKQYFALLERGIDILTDDGFLIPNWRDYV